MPFRTVFEALGDFLYWTLELVPFLGDYANLLFMGLIAGGAIYWIRTMMGHQRAGQK